MLLAAAKRRQPEDWNRVNAKRLDASLAGDAVVLVLRMRLAALHYASSASCMAPAIRQHYVQRPCKRRVLDWQLEVSSVLLERLRSLSGLECCRVLRGGWALELIGERWLLSEVEGRHCACCGILAAPAPRHPCPHK